jgi:DNA polymerase
MNLLTLDFETYFDTEYSLRKLTTEAYVRDPRFKAHCLGVKVRDNPAYIESYLTGNFNGGIICHHAQFDGFILNHHYGIRPAFWFDTLSMARLVHPHLKSHSLEAMAELYGLQAKTVPYKDFIGKRDLDFELQLKLESGCLNDVEITYEIFKQLLPQVPKEELRIIDLTVRMFTEPALELDIELMTAYQNADIQNKTSLLEALNIEKTDLVSDAKFADCLEKLGVAAPKKISPRTEKEAYAFAKTDDGFKELLTSENDAVRELAECRLAVKSNIIESRTGRLLEMSSRGALPVYLKYYGAHTGRWSGGDAVNWQNFKRGSDMRLSIMAPRGYVLCVGDLAQIECRMLNWLAGEDTILDAFREGRDLYSEGASRFYGTTITKANKTERHLGKTIELGCGYGMGADKFQMVCRQGALGGAPITLSDYESKKAIDSYRNSHRKVVALWKYADSILPAIASKGHIQQWGCMHIQDSKIYYPNGGWSDYSHLRHDGKDYYTLGRKGKSKIYGAKLIENVVQALSRVVISQAMLKIAERYKIVMTVHDEIVWLAPEAEAQAALDFGLDIMKTVPAWCEGLPLDAEGGFDVRYSK